MTFDEILKMPVEEVDQLLWVQMGRQNWPEVPNYHSDDNAMRQVRQVVRERGLILRFVERVGIEGARSLVLTAPQDFSIFLIDAPTELQARCALWVLKEGEK